MPKDIHQLLAGYQQFKSQYFNGIDSTFSEFVDQGQKPKVMIVSCADSRVDPSLLFRCRPGDLFVVRNVANLVPPYESDQGHHGTSAALEFAVCNLEVRHIIILGHSHCGGIQSLFERDTHAEQEQGSSFLRHWMELASPAYVRAKQECPSHNLAQETLLCGQYALLQSIENLQTFPWIQTRHLEKKLFLHAWQFDLETGRLLAANLDTQTFEAL